MLHVLASHQPAVALAHTARQWISQISWCLPYFLLRTLAQPTDAHTHIPMYPGT